MTVQNYQFSVYHNDSLLIYVLIDGKVYRKVVYKEQMKHLENADWLDAIYGKIPIDEEELKNVA